LLSGLAGLGFKSFNEEGTFDFIHFVGLTSNSTFYCRPAAATFESIVCSVFVDASWTLPLSSWPIAEELSVEACIQSACFGLEIPTIVAVIVSGTAHCLFFKNVLYSLLTSAIRQM